MKIGIIILCAEQKEKFYDSELDEESLQNLKVFKTQVSWDVIKLHRPLAKAL